MEKIGRCFGLHPLTMEDIVNTGQRPKYEDFEDYVFVVLKMLSFDRTAGSIKAEQVSLIFGPRFALSFT